MPLAGAPGRGGRAVQAAEHGAQQCRDGRRRRDRSRPGGAGPGRRTWRPHTDMNPVLLKPNSDTGSQVIIHGRAVTSMNAVAYHDYKAIAMQAVLASHARLSAAYPVVMVEGAGSPAEINLRANDIANMGFAEAVDCPARVQGFIINRFRGDIALLQPGLDWLEARTGKPVVGVLPYVMDLHLEAEDGIDQRQIDKAAQVLRVVVPVLPRISNHTDFDPLRLHPQVDLQFVRPGQAIPSADLIILPGSKSVRSDLAYLRANGWDTAVTRHLRYGGKVLGICGGLQMLGEQVHDPLGLEGLPGSSDGLGLLAFSTTLEAEKQLRNVRGRLLLEDAEVSGYEIHAGRDVGQCAGARRGTPGGWPLRRCPERGRTNPRHLSAWRVRDARRLQCLVALGRLQAVQAVDYHALRERDIERLADLVEHHLDTGLLRRLCGVAPCVN
ncbi:hypothetical protein L1887_53117 [Cichorium endivia]|nr:hypothetical protein L1887_53117 [Cichorium endivia]